VIQITVSPAAYDAIKSSLPKGARKLTPMRDAAGEYLIHLEPAVVGLLAAMRGPGESYSKVILRLAAADPR
jgi:hypothetical protein